TLPPPPTSPLFPYTTLFRSIQDFIPRASSGRRQERAEGRLARASIRFRGAVGCPMRSIREGRGLSLLCLRSDCAESRRPCLAVRSEEHTSELQSRENLVCRL